MIPFDKVAWSVMAVALLITVAMLWRGDQIGLHVVTLVPAAETAGISPKSQLRIRFDQALDAAKVGRSKAQDNDLCGFPRSYV